MLLASEISVRGIQKLGHVDLFYLFGLYSRIKNLETKRLIKCHSLKVTPLFHTQPDFLIEPDFLKTEQETKANQSSKKGRELLTSGQCKHMAFSSVLNCLICYKLLFKKTYINVLKLTRSGHKA